MTPEERARSLLLPFSDGTEVLIPPGLVPDEEPEQLALTQFPRPYNIQKILQRILSYWTIVHGVFWMRQASWLPTPLCFPLLSTWMGLFLSMTQTLFRLLCLCSQIAWRNFEKNLII